MISTDVLEFVDEIIPQARKLLETDGRLLPVCFILAEKQVTVCGLVLPDDRDGKNEMYRAIEAHARSLKAEAVLMIVESWMGTVDVNNLQEWDQLPPSERPDRQEVVVVNLFTQEGNKYAMMPITYKGPQDEIKTFGNIEWLEDVAGMEGPGVIRL